MHLSTYNFMYYAELVVRPFKMVTSRPTCIPENYPFLWKG